ncbi:MAG: ATP-binding protein [Planctomycetota bacterium]
MEHNEQRSAKLSRVLAAANDTGSAQKLEHALASWDIRTVCITTTRAEALAAHRSDSPFDLVIVDCHAACGDAFELISTFRVKGERAPILVLMEDDSIESLNCALHAGTDDVLQKPYDLASLRSAVSSLFARSNEREKFNGRTLTAPLHGADVRVLGDGDDTTLTLTAPTHSAQLDSFQRVCERVAARGLPESERMHLHLALEELLQNAREWGNRFDTSKHIRFSFTPKSDRVMFGIEDEGDGFNPADIPDPSIDPLAHIKRRIASGKRIGGWGLFIARKRMDKVAFNAKGNAVYITKLFQSAPSLDDADLDI